jgi:hypothetical protein
VPNIGDVATAKCEECGGEVVMTGYEPVPDRSQGEGGFAGAGDLTEVWKCRKYHHKQSDRFTPDIP